MKCDYCGKNTAVTKTVPVIRIEKDSKGRPIEVHAMETITVCMNPDCPSNKEAESDE